MNLKKIARIFAIAMIGFEVTAPLSVAFASEENVVAATSSQEQNKTLSYYKIETNGNGGKYAISDTQYMEVVKGSAESFVIRLYKNDSYDEENLIEEWDVPIDEKVHTLQFGVEEIRINISYSEEFKTSEIIPEETFEDYVVILENSNGSIMKQSALVDEHGIVLELRDKYQYFILEENEVIQINFDEYEAFNQSDTSDSSNTNEAEDQSDNSETTDSSIEEENSSEESSSTEESLGESDLESSSENNDSSADGSQVSDGSTEESTQESVMDEDDELSASSIEPDDIEAEEESREETGLKESSESVNNSEKKVVAPSMATFSAPKASTYQVETSVPTVTYETHIQSRGWIETAFNGGTSGTQGSKKRIEAIKIRTPDPTLGISYSTHVEKTGWTSSKSNGQISGSVGSGLRIEAIKISLTGSNANQYDIYYRVHAESYGWLGWAKNGNPSGTEGLAKRIEAIEILTVKKGEPAPGDTGNSFLTKESQSNISPNTSPKISYSSYVQGAGWQKNKSNGEMSGTNGAAKRIEAIRIGVENIAGLNVQYQSHVQSYGWTDWSNGAAINGYPGAGKRVEAIKIKLTGENASQYDVYYRVHSERFGWLGWAKNGEPAGTEGYGFRAEAFEVKYVPKNSAFSRGGDAYRKADNASVSYSTHIQSIGWLSSVTDGKTSGTSNRALRMEAIKIITKNDQYTGGIQYRTHVQSYGWMNNVSNGAISGTTGKEKRIEAIQINLTGQMAQKYDIFYRVYTQSYGWLGWASNGMSAGTEGMEKRVEAIEIKLIEKGLVGPTVVAEKAFKKFVPPPTPKKKVIFLDPGHGATDSGASYGGYHEKNLNLQIALRIERLLKAAGFDVIMTRRTDTYTDFKTGVSKLANASGADIFISLHHNAMPTNFGVHGIETFWYEYDPEYEPVINKDMHNDPSRLANSKKLAEAVQSSLISATGAYDRKVQRDTFAVLRETKLPAILVEFGFMSNEKELNNLINASYQEKMAQALVNGVKNYFK